MTKNRPPSQQSSLAAAQAHRWRRQKPDQEATPEPINPGVKVERRNLLRSVRWLRVAVYWLAESVTADMKVRLE
jgi:hypothetical protein